MVRIKGEAIELLEEMDGLGLFKCLELGKFGDVKRPQDGGKGLAGVTLKEKEYFNPFIELFLEKEVN